MTDEKLILLKRHPCSEGLDDQVLREIADACEVLKTEPGDTIQQNRGRFDSVYLVILGCINISVVDVLGRVVVKLSKTAGEQFGALACALSEPAPVEMLVEEPSTLLRLPYQQALALTREHPSFRDNFSRLIADAVLKMIVKDHTLPKPKSVAVFHCSPDTRLFTRRLILRLLELDERPHLLSDQQDWQGIEGVPFYNLMRDGKYVSAAEVPDQMKYWSHSKRTILDVHFAVDLDRAIRIHEVCETVFWCVTPETWQESLEKLNAIIQRAPQWRQKINVVWLLPGDRPWAPLAPELSKVAKRDFKLSFDPPAKTQSNELMNGFERIIHYLRGVQIGLALGGGAARGMAHLGVLKELERNGIIIDMIAGTSAGALTGILYASGMEPDYNVQSFIRDLTPSWFFRHIPNGGYWYLLSKYRRGKFDPMLRPYLKDSRLEQLPIPFQSVTVDLVGAQSVVRAQGDSVHSITESINLPVLSRPINRDGRSLVDGGIINNIPADVLVASGCNFVIAVSVTAGIQKEFSSNRPDMETAQMKPASALKTILRTYVVQNVNMNSIGVAPADFVIQPDVTGFDITEFTRADKMAAIGAQATLDAVPELKEALAKIDARLFNSKG